MSDTLPEGEGLEHDAPALDHDEPSNDDRARMHGWKPLEEFSGNPRDWRDADEFLKINDRSAAAATERLRKMEREVKRLTQGANLAEERWRTAERAKIRQEMAQAAEAGDVDRVNKLADGLERTSQPSQAQGEPSEVQAFRERNAWYGVDPVRTAQAQRISNDVRAMNPDMSVADELKTVEAEMNRLSGSARPSADRRPAMPTADVTGGVRLAPKTTNQFDKLPWSAKQMFESLKAQNVYTDEDREAYAADYGQDTFTIERKKRA